MYTDKNIVCLPMFLDLTCFPSKGYRIVALLQLHLRLHCKFTGSPVLKLKYMLLLEFYFLCASGPLK